VIGRRAFPDNSSSAAARSGPASARGSGSRRHRLALGASASEISPQQTAPITTKGAATPAPAKCRSSTPGALPPQSVRRRLAGGVARPGTCSRVGRGSTAAESMLSVETTKRLHSRALRVCGLARGDECTVGMRSVRSVWCSPRGYASPSVVGDEEPRAHAPCQFDERPGQQGRSAAAPTGASRRQPAPRAHVSAQSRWTISYRPMLSARMSSAGRMSSGTSARTRSGIVLRIVSASSAWPALA